MYHKASKDTYNTMFPIFLADADDRKDVFANPI